MRSPYSESLGKPKRGRGDDSHYEGGVAGFWERTSWCSRIIFERGGIRRLMVGSQPCLWMNCEPLGKLLFPGFFSSSVNKERQYFINPVWLLWRLNKVTKVKDERPQLPGVVCPAHDSQWENSPWDETNCHHLNYLPQSETSASSLSLSFSIDKARTILSALRNAFKNQIRR